MKRTILIKSVFTILSLGILLGVAALLLQLEPNTPVFVDNNEFTQQDTVVERGTAERLIDTDKDGTPDFEEVLRGTDPLVANRPESTTYTFDPVDVPHSIADSFNELFPLRTRSVSEKAVTEEKESEDEINEDPIRVYGNTTGEIIVRHLGEGSEEVSLFNAVIQEQTASAFAALSSVVEKYQAVARDLDEVIAEKGVAEEHEMLVDAYRKQAQAVLRVKNADAYENIDWLSYTDDVVFSAQTLINLAMWFRDNDIVFAEGETGYIFTQIAHK